MEVLGFGNKAAGLRAVGGLERAARAVGVTAERLSSGLRINHASDDPAGLAISTSLKVGSRVYGRALLNLQDGISILNMTDSTLDSITVILTRLAELAEQASNGVYSGTQLSALDHEAQELAVEYERIIGGSFFNGMRILDGTLSSLSLQAGFGAEERLSTPILAVASLGAGTSSSSTTTTTETVGDGTFGATSKLGGAVESIRVTDVNGDGKPDFIGAGAGQVTVRFGVGNGTFGSPATYVQGANWECGMAVGDITGDSKPDIVYTSLVTDRVYTLRNQGDGTFVNGSGYLMGDGQASGARLADLNGDSKLDIVAGSVTGDHLHVLLGHNDGTFDPPDDITSGDSPNTLRVADLDGDNRRDIIVVHYNPTGGISVLKGNGDGSFAAPVDYATAPYANDIQLGDLNRDGVLDVVVGYADSPAGVGVLLGTGSGAFGAVTNYYIGYNGGASIDVADFNGDENLDVVFASWDYAPGVFVLFGHENGALDAPTLLDDNFVENITFIDVADINMDGVADIQLGLRGGSNGGATILTNVTTRDVEVEAGEGLSSNVSLSTQAAARASLDLATLQLDAIARQRGVIGANRSRCESALHAIAARRDNFIAAESRISNVDISQESAGMVASRIRQEAAAAMSANTNLSSLFLLDLIRAPAISK